MAYSKSRRPASLGEAELVFRVFVNIKGDELWKFFVGQEQLHIQTGEAPNLV